MTDVPPGGSTAEAGPVSVRNALARILQSPDFDATPRSRRFLTYIVEETLGGRAERIKAFSIATDVFGRGADFDAHSDPIVRLEAGRLRRALEQYYQRAGSEDPVVISIPKGAYVPVFQPRVVLPANQPGAAAERRPLAVGAAAVLGLLAVAAWFVGASPWRGDPAAPAVPRLLVRPFEDLTQSGSSANFAKGLTHEIIGQVAKFKDIVTVEDRDADANAAQSARYELSGSVSLAEDKVRLQARILSTEDASVLWAQTYEADFEPSQVIAIEKAIASQVATALGQPYGVIFRADSERSVPQAPDDWAAYSCTLSYYAYRANIDAKTHPVVRQCLEDAVERFPNYATAWALLSQTYIDEIRFGYPIDPTMSPASLDRALAAARRAMELDPQNVRALEAEMFALYFSGQIDASLALGKQALATNPNDTELMGEYGSRLAVSGRWEEGCNLIAEARERNPGPLGYYEAILSVCAYFRGDYKTAIMWIGKSGAIENPAYHLIAAAVLAEAGRAEEAAAERDWLMAHARGFVEDIWAWTALRYARAEDRERFVGSLRKSGLPIPPRPAVSDR
ncbi:hypothetical protein [Rhizobium subbaraonis]|uniref:hypothetical protein n=1 Tax=Rhizobium subbaraonis TaxID=908946 RepID=UPI000BE33BEF|nr:hypothetical protein [Rhizobium subbaraonis]